MNITSSQIIFSNPQWRTNQVLEQQSQLYRSAYKTICKWLPDRTAIIIKGLRRTGKSYLMMQLRDQFIAVRNIPAKNYLNFSFDTEDIFELYPSSSLEQLLNYFFTNILNKHPSELTEPVLITIDELQNVEGWQRVIKQYYDLSPLIKFIVTGSASLFISESAESLAGRVLEFQIPPLDFWEFLDFYGAKDNTQAATSIAELFEIVPQVVSEERQRLFELFLLCGDLPETALMCRSGKSVEEIQYYIQQSVVQKIVGRDLRKYFGLRSAHQDLKLLQILAAETGNQINLTRLSREISMAIETLKVHLSAFEKSHLLLWLSCFDPKLRKQYSAHPKFYLTSSSVILSTLDERTVPHHSLAGHVAESYLYQRLLKLTDQLFFARYGSDQEVDFFCPKEKVMLECKYQDHVSSDVLEELIKVAGRFSLKPILVSRNSLDEQPSFYQRIKTIPISYL